jgi:hypothetical protein
VSSGGRPAGRWAVAQPPFLTATSSLSSSRKTRFSSEVLDLTTNFPLAPSSRTRLRSSVLRMIYDSRPLPMVPPRVHPKLPKRAALGSGKPGDGSTLNRVPDTKRYATGCRFRRRNLITIKCADCRICSALWVELLQRHFSRILTGGSRISRGGLCVGTNLDTDLYSRCCRASYVRNRHRSPSHHTRE